MHIIHASPHLVQAVHGIIAVSMAAHLLRRSANLNDDTAVTVTLAQTGFGLTSIRSLRAHAVEIARQTIAARMKAH